MQTTCTVEVWTRESKMIVHRAVPAALLRFATGRDFDMAKETEQSDFLEHLQERVGPDPGGEQWKREAVVLIKEEWVQRGVLESMDADTEYEKKLVKSPWARTFQAFCKGPYEKSIARRVKNSGHRLTLEDAQLCALLGPYGKVLAAAAQAARQDYAGLTHRYCSLIANLAVDARPACDCCWFLKHTSGSKTAGLQDQEPNWAKLIDRATTAAHQSRARKDRHCKLHGVHCITAPGPTIVWPVESKFLAPEGYRFSDTVDGKKVQNVQDSAIVRFVSGPRDAAGFHTAVHTDPDNCVFPPMTLFTVVDVQLGSFQYDGTELLIRRCKTFSDGRAPIPVHNATGRLHIGRHQLIEWLVGLKRPDDCFSGDLLSDNPRERKASTDWFHSCWLPPGVESTIYTVNRTCITVQATFLLPKASAPTAVTSTKLTASAAADAAASAAKPSGAAYDKLTANSFDLG
jgi:hypothetical protein